MQHGDELFKGSVLTGDVCWACFHARVLLFVHLLSVDQRGHGEAAQGWRWMDECDESRVSGRIALCLWLHADAGASLRVRAVDLHSLICREGESGEFSTVDFVKGDQ